MEKLNVAIADDNEKMVEILGRMIEEDKDLTLVGKAHNGEEICNIIKEREPMLSFLTSSCRRWTGLLSWKTVSTIICSRKRRRLSSYQRLDRNGSQRTLSALAQNIIC